MTLRVTGQYVEALGAASGVVRVSRQYAEIIGAGAGAARVTRQYVEVLGSATIHFAAVNQPIVLAGALAPALDLGVHVSQPAEISSAIDVRGPTYVSIQQGCGLSDDLDGHRAVTCVSVVDPIELESSAGRAYTVDVASTLTLSHASERLSMAESVLDLAQTVSAGLGADIESGLDLVSSVTTTAILSVGLTTALGVVHSGTYQLVDGDCVTRSYSPFVGFSSDTTIEPPPVVQPAIGAATLTLTYPLESPTHTVVLRNPEFGNKEVFTVNRINRETRGGTLVVYADSNWPKNSVLSVDVRNLRDSQVAQLLEFLGVSLGLEIGLLDHENRQWRGIITDPDAAISTPERADQTISFMFEGELC